MAKKTYLDFNTYAKYSNCFVNSEAVELLKKEGSVICRYMPYSRLEKWIKESIMTFVSPNRWDDPFEKIYLNTILTNSSLRIRYKPPRIASLCFSKSLFKDSVAFWNNFKTSDSEQLVRVEFNFKKMMIQLIKLLEQYDMHIYVVAVNYSLQQKIIKNKEEFVNRILRSHGNEVDAEFLYIKILSYKRKAFSFENEVRVILVPQKKIEFDKNECFVVEGMDYNAIIENIWLEPIRLPSGWISEDSVRERLPKFKKKINQSPLYDEQEKCKKIDLEQLKIRGV